MEWIPGRIHLFREVGLCQSQSGFAKALGFAMRTIGNAERGTHSPSLALRRALDEALDKASDAQRDRFLAAVAATASRDLRALSSDLLGDVIARANLGLKDNNDKYVLESDESVLQRTLAICGSRSADTDAVMIDGAVRELGAVRDVGPLQDPARPSRGRYRVMTYIADHYRPSDLTMAIGLFGRPNVVRNVD